MSIFSKLNLFSGLNNLEDITIKQDYATITGYTHADLGRHFGDYLVSIDMEEVQRWNNEYNYFGEPIYTPFDILLFLSNGCDFSNYWWQIGNPSFLIEMLRKKEYYLPDIENMVVSVETLNAFDVESIDLVALLWQTGYLTFDKKIVEAGFYELQDEDPQSWTHRHDAQGWEGGVCLRIQGGHARRVSPAPDTGEKIL